MEIAALFRLASDQRLAEHVSAGSERAFEVLYDRHHRGVLSFCRHMLGSREEAEDALQHTFMAAYRDLRRSGAPAALRPWLFVIARNRCISVLRVRREHPAAEVPELATDHLATEVAAREELRAVLTAVSRLPDDQRAALVLAELGDVSHDDIARILDCRREQVKSYVYQARATLATDRMAREMPCSDIREQLTEMRGGQLRRAPLRRHLHDCDGCREFRETLSTQRRQLGLLLPVAPSFGLKRAVLGAALGGGGGAGGLSLGGLAATAVLVVAIPAGTAAVASGSDEPIRTSPAVRTSAPVTTASPVATTARTRDSGPRRAERAPRKVSSHADEKARPRDHETPKAAAREETSASSESPAPVEETSAPSEQPAAPQPASPPEQTTPKSPPGQAKTPPGQAKTPPGHAKTPPGQAKTPPGQDMSQSAPGQTKPKSAPGQDKSDPGNPASPPGQDNKPEHAAEPGPPPSPPGQAKEPGSPAGQGPVERPGRGNGRG